MGFFFMCLHNHVTQTEPALRNDQLSIRLRKKGCRSFNKHQQKRW